MPDIRQLREDEFEAALELSRFAFQYTPTPEDVERARRNFRPGEVWGSFVGDELAAQLTIYPYKAFIGGRALAMGGIANVATWPHQRRQGHVAALLSHALATMREAGQSISFLYPFKTAFYRRFGWELASHKLRYTLERSDLPSPGGDDGTWTPIKPDQWQRLAEVYTAFARRYEGMLDRSEGRWRDFVLTSRRHAHLHERAGQPDAYLVYEVSEREFRLVEAAWLSEEARRDLWAFVAQHDSMVDRITWEAPSDDRLAFLLDNPAFRQELRPSFMARIVDLPAFLGQYRFRPGSPFEFSLALEDRQAAWNAGTWRIDVEGDGRASTERTERPADLSCDANTLSAMLLGYLTPGEATSFGRLSGRGEAAAALEEAIGRRTPHLFDFF